MKNKIFLSSMLIMSVAPAMAENFPTDGLMQENKTYDNAATSTNMDGVYSGTVNATAEYDTIDYILSAGQYLPADSETKTTCPVGSFCPGGSTVQYNQTTAQGIQTCPTGYASSIAGASSDTECYRQCSGNVTIAHATGVTGNDYYGNGVDTCEPTGCVNGYHKNEADVVAKTPIVPFDYNDAGLGYEYINANGVFGDDGDGISDLSLTDNNTWAMVDDDGILYGKASCQPDNDAASLYLESNGGKVLNGNMSVQEFMAGFIPIVGQEKANWVLSLFQQYANGQLTQIDMAAKLALMFNTHYNTNYSTSDKGRYCFCQVDGYKPNNDVRQNINNAPWVYKEIMSDISGCDNRCASYCAELSITQNLNLRGMLAAMIGAFDKVNASCEANTITINWSDVDPEYAGQNNEGTATYGSDVRTPVKAQTIKGKTFRGWRFSAPTQTTTGN